MKTEVEITGQVTKITDLESRLTKAEATVVDYEQKKEELV
jgi:hypothetical protein